MTDLEIYVLAVPAVLLGVCWVGMKAYMHWDAETERAEAVAQVKAGALRHRLEKEVQQNRLAESELVFYQERKAQRTSPPPRRLWALRSGVFQNVIQPYAAAIMTVATILDIGTPETPSTPLRGRDEQGGHQRRRDAAHQAA